MEAIYSNLLLAEEDLEATEMVSEDEQVIEQFFGDESYDDLEDFESSIENEQFTEQSENHWEDIESDSSDDDESIDDLFSDTHSELQRMVGEINRDIERMNVSEATDYMDQRMGEFWPALVAALPTILQLAPAAIQAISSFTGRSSQAPTTPSPGPQRPVQRSVTPTPPSTATIPS